MRLALVFDGGTGVGAAQHLRLIELTRLAAGADPIGETWRRLERIVAFTRQKIAKTKLEGIFVHNCPLVPPRIAAATPVENCRSVTSL